jgi:ubiquinone/menaquinone biosynthesis C-methylase UbiE
VGKAESSGLPDASCDLVTAAQALHWFDPPAFFAEAHRVLKPGGAIAVWTYVDPELVEPAVDAVLQDFAREVRGDWPPERLIAESGYRGLDFPFDELAEPALHLELSPTADELAGYLSTWSATQRYIKRTGTDPVPKVARRLQALWPEGERRLLRWPMHIRAGVRRA